MNVSDELLWALVRSNTSFLHKRNGRTKRSGKIVLTSEPNNLMNLNSYKYSGLANSKAVGITVGKDKKDRTCGSLSIKSSKKKNQPKKAVSTSLVKKSFHNVANSLKKQTGGMYYRGDLERAALARWSKVFHVMRVQKGLSKPMPVSTGRKNLKATSS